MSGFYRVYLDGILLNNEPENLQDTELTITRDPDLKGIFLEYTSDVTFWGDGYTYIKTTADANNQCATIQCLIQYRCDEFQLFQTLFEGVIPTGGDGIEWNDTDCSVTVKIENADFSNFLKTYGDLRIPINTTGARFSVDGTTSITPATAYEVEVFQDSSPANYLATTVRMYEFIDVLRYSLAYLTNDELTLDADPLYTTDFEPQRYEIQFLGGINTGDTITWTFTNFYGQTYTVTVTLVGGSGLADEAILPLFHYVDPTISTVTRNQTNYFAKGGLYINIGSLFIDNYLPWQSFSVVHVDSGGNHRNTTITEVNPFQYGLNGLCLTTSSRLKFQDSIIYVTLNELMLHAAQMHNMGYQIVKVSGGYELRLRQYSSLINNVDIGLTLPNVNQITSRPTGAFNLSTLNTAEGSTDVAFVSNTARGNLCYGETLSIEGANFSTQEIFNVLINDFKENEIYWIFADLSTEQAIRYRATTMDGVNPPANITFYNAPYIFGLIARQYDVFFANNPLRVEVLQSPFDPASAPIVSVCPTCPNGQIANTNQVLLLKEYDFEYPLSFSQAQNIINNAINYLRFEDGRGTLRNGFVSEIRINLGTFVATFKMLGNA